MLKMIITEAVVSKGYESAPAIRFYDCEGGGQTANFRVGKRVYDKKAKDNHRWLNFNVKAFGDMTERIKQMKLKEGSYINIIARYDEDTWVDKNTQETRTGTVLYLEEIEYAGGGSGQKSGQSSANGGASQGGSTPEPAAAAPRGPVWRTAAARSHALRLYRLRGLRRHRESVFLRTGSDLNKISKA